MPTYRTERDLLGERQIPGGALHGIHTLRALENFPLARRPVHPQLIRAFGTVKLACAITNHRLAPGTDDQARAGAIQSACREMAAGRLDQLVIVDALQGGAGTSTNMNVNEVLANRALQLLGEPLGNYQSVCPLADINRHQSTNDTYPTALRLAAIRLLDGLEQRVVELQEAFESAEKRLADIVKVGRTQYQDAVLTTLGREMSAYAGAMARDRWRIYKCQERLREINLGGTAIGSGLGAPRQYIFQVVDVLREITGIGFARADNLTDATQNADVFAEVSGILKAHAVSLIKICGDLRLLSSGPETGLGEINVPPRQAGSSIMPGKVNPVIPEAATQAAMMVIGHDAALTAACAAGSLELNAFLPLVAHCLLDSIDLLTQADFILARRCVAGITANSQRCQHHVRSSTALATALVPAIGYAAACDLAAKGKATGRSIQSLVVGDGVMPAREFEALITPEAVCRLGTPDPVNKEELP